MPPSYSEGVLDASISFGRRTSTRLSLEPAPLEERESEQYDFLALVTAVAELYAQEDILEMQCRRDTGQPFARGAVSEVSRIHAAVTKPSAVVSNQVERRNHVVVLKRSGGKLFLPNGQHSDTSAMKGFISELRILSHKPVREHPNIIKILGVNWDFFETGYPEPLLLLEKASTDLATFQSRHRSLPFETKKSISLDIAKGLFALHQIGVIHGDLKPENVLIFKRPTLHAKIADFSHSVLDTGETRTLVGGTRVYSAPEWSEPAPTGDLLKTDIYSYGLVFGGLMLGAELVTTVQQHPPFDLHTSTTEAITRLKAGDHMKEYLSVLIHIVDQENQDSDLHEFPCICKVLENTVQVDPETRSLRRVLSILEGREAEPRRVQRIDRSLTSNAISIPYDALHSLSPVITDQVIRSLMSVAASAGDTRRAAAWMELAVCHICENTWSAHSNPSTTDWRTAALSAMLSAADLGEVWARAVVWRVSQALGADIPAHHPINAWLFDAASNGSWIAMESLSDLDPVQAGEALRTYRTTYCGNQDRLYCGLEMKPDHLRDPALIVNSRRDTVLHWLASTGDEAMLKALLSSGLDSLVIDNQNGQGDTPLLCAARAGHFGILEMLTSHLADASIVNTFLENPLHFLNSFDRKDVPAAARLLVSAGAELDAEATGDSGNSYLDPSPRGKSCPRLRAIFTNNPIALRTLLALTTQAFPASTARQGIPLSNQKLLLAWALRLHHVEILEVLGDYFRHSQLLTRLSNTNIWISGRRHSLPALCILGCALGNSSSGFDAPERFFRILTHGKDYVGHLEKSLLFLSGHEPSILKNPCNGARNALFYAITTGRSDALRFLTTYPRPGCLFNGPHNRWTRCKEINGLLTPVVRKREDDLRDDRRHGFATAGGDKRRDGPSPTTNELVDSPANSGDEGFESCDDPDGNSEQEDEYLCPHYLIRRDLGRRREHGRGRRRAARRTTVINFLEGPFVLSHQPEDYSPREHHFRDGASDEGQDDPLLPFNYQRLEGMVDAVLMSILYGRRRIFHDLVTGVAKQTIQTPPPFPCFLNTQRSGSRLLHYGNESVDCLARGHTPRNLIQYFPIHVWDHRLTVDHGDHKSFDRFDGILQYSLLYMTAIARSTHRDIFLARTLLSVMREMHVPYPREWTAGSAFESACLSLNGPGPHAAPLYYAAYSMWDELAILLMEHGATPQGRCWNYPDGRDTVGRDTVLSRLCGTTKGANGEVRNLLTMASSVDVDRVLVLDDITMLLDSYPKHEGLIRWEDGKLGWVNYYESPPLHYVQLWDALARANVSQRQKVRADGRWRKHLVADAVQRRDMTALRCLLDFGLNVNQRVKSRDGSLLRPTALDIVSWTATVEPKRWGDGGIALREHDRRIAEFLVSRGAIRGPDYVFEYLLGLTVLQCVILPVGGPLLLFFLGCFFKSKVSDLVGRSWAIRESTLGEEHQDRLGENISLLLYISGFIFDGLGPIGIWETWSRSRERCEDGCPRPFSTRAIWTCTLFFALWLVIFVSRSTVLTNGRTGEAFFLDILTDACLWAAFGCGLALWYAPVAMFMSLLLNPPRGLCQLQEHSSLKVVWGATHSVLQPHISRWRTRFLDFSRQVRDVVYYGAKQPLMKRMRRLTGVGQPGTEDGVMLLGGFSESD